MQARAYTPPWRIVFALLIVTARVSLLVLLVLLLFFETRLTNPLRLIRLFTLFCLVPELAAWFLGRVFDVALRVDGGALVVDQPRRRIEIPLDSIDRFEPWPLPLPAPGMWIRLKSGNLFQYGVEVANPADLVGPISDAGGDERLREALRERGPAGLLRLVVGSGVRRWNHLLLKFPVFALVPALPLFRLHQWITYGGTFGEYYQYGLQAYVLAFLIYWANATIWLVLYAAGLRAVVAIGVLGVAFAIPSRATAIARVGDVARGVLYFGGVAVFLVRLYLLSRV